MTKSQNQKNRVRGMRKAGLSIGTIAKEEGLSKSTVSSWVRDVKLSRELLLNLSKNSRKGLDRALRVVKEKRLDVKKKIDIEAGEIVKSLNLSEKSSCQLTAAMLFWCEGGKTELGSVKFANSDPALIRTFLYCLRRGFNIDEGKFHALIHLHGYHNEKKQKRFWSLITGIPMSQFHKSYRKPNTGKRKRQDYQGCLSIRYGEANVAKMLSSIYHAFADRVGP